MGWKHQCTCPGNFRIWLRQARSGAIWSCRCGTFWELRRRSLIPGHSHWEWHLHDDEPQTDEPVPQGAHSETERAWWDDTDEYNPRPEVQLGFQREQR